MKLCETCRYGSEYELDKPCVVYREDCPLYQKEGEEMTNEKAIEELKAIKSAYSNKTFGDSRLMRSEIEALELAIVALKFRENIVAYAENLIEQDAKHYYGYVKITNILKAQAEVEPQESDRKCHTCKHYTSGEYDGSCDSYVCEHYSGWESDNCN